MLRNSGLALGTKQKGHSRHSHRDEGGNGPDHRVLEDAVLAVVDELTAHHPRPHAAERKEVWHLWLVLHGGLQIHAEIQVVEQVHHEVVNDVRLVAFAQRVHVDGVLRKEEADPLQVNTESIRFLVVFDYNDDDPLTAFRA